MNLEYILGKVSEIMHWDTDRSRDEFAWLGLMAKIKYDGYEDFRAGVRFVESLADWLQQFPQAEREVAYGFIRRHLVYIGPAEMNHLVELFFPETVQWRLMQAAANQCGCPTYRVWADAAATALYQRLLRQTLFLELSDGARIDVFRRANAGIVSNEQIITAPRINRAKPESSVIYNPEGKISQEKLENPAGFWNNVEENTFSLFQNKGAFE